jgi:hypothetical protein
MNLVKGTASDARVVEQIDDLIAHSGFVEDNINSALGGSGDFVRLTLAIEEMECVIGRAISGEAPNSFTWGPLTAPEFLRIEGSVFCVSGVPVVTFLGFRISRMRGPSQLISAQPWRMLRDSTNQ